MSVQRCDIQRRALSIRSMHFCENIGGDNPLYIDSIFSHIPNFLHDERACSSAVDDSISAAQSIVAYSARITETE